MSQMLRPLFSVISSVMLVTTITQAAGPEDGQAAFSLRETTMKQMGRAFYGTIGRVVKSKAEPGPDAIAAAEKVVGLVGNLTNLFPPGSDVGESRIKPEIFFAQARVIVLIQDVQSAAAQLALAAKGGDRAGIASAFQALNGACEACHREFRKPVE
jgi:cytochrome c556